MSGKLKLYLDFLSQPSRATYIILKLSGIPFETIPICLEKGEHFTDEYKEVNRFQKVPCIVDTNGFKLAESVAILRYLHGDGRIKSKWYPSDFKERARVDEYLEWQHLNIRANCALYFLYKWLSPKMGKTPKPEKIEKLRIKMEDCLDVFENDWLGSKRFVSADNITVADIFAACEIEEPKIAGYDPTKSRPKLKAWLEAVRKETNPYYDEAHKALYELAAKAGVA